MSLFSAIGSYEDAWKAIIMPFRQEYSVYDLGPTEFNARENRIKRSDFRLLNKRGQTIECSYFQQVNIDHPIPCVVYLHGNGCSRIEALHYTDLVLSKPVSFFCFDFSGCGKSGGEYTSVGWHEQEDLECVIQYLHNTGKVTKIAVWGRSMGAVTTILYANKDPRITCCIFDSPFSNFKQLVKELAKQKASIPGFIVTGAFGILRKTIINKANFDIDALRPIRYVDKIKVPALFGTAKDDTFVSPKHTKDLYMAYGGSKQLMIFEGDHNSQRPFNWMLLVQDFIKVQLLEEKDESQNVRQSFKQPFNPAEKEKNTQVTVSSTTEIKSDSVNLSTMSLQEPAPGKRTSPLLPQPQRQLPQNNMTFTWLDHSASSPNLSIKSPSQVSLSDKSVQESVADKENGQQGKSTAPSEKRLQKLFADNRRDKQAMNQNPVPRSAQINLDISNITNKELHKKENMDKSPTLREHSKPVNFSLKENLVPANKKPEDKLTKNTSTSNLSNHGNISIFGPKKKEVRSENIVGSPPKLVHALKSDHSLREIPTSKLNNASNILASTEAHQSHHHKPIHRADSYPTKSTTAQDPDGPNLSLPLSNVQSRSRERKNLTSMFPPMMPLPLKKAESQRDPKRIFDIGSQAQKTNKTLTTRSPSKSFTIDKNNLKPGKENTSPIPKPKTLLLQVKLNSDIPIINPTQRGPNANLDYITQSLNNISQMDSRRSSDITVKSHSDLSAREKRSVGLNLEPKGYRDNLKIPANLIETPVVKTSNELPPKGPQREVRAAHELVK